MRSCFAIFGILIIISGVAISYFAQAAWFSTPDAGEPIEIVVKEGMAPDAVRDLLIEADLVSSKWMYDLYGTLDDAVENPKAGTYRFRPGTSYREIADALAIGPERNALKLRFVEGNTLDE
ncbi:hypothetical protein GF380_02765, partial [Candidatus Uhrbacteria bacterium]|nr:hypothetical protein [Candidatus Uhrbacteria bacterium]MBD3284078.1 hypothetical protein [Candidatus Uhrbacteria bacterium]